MEENENLQAIGTQIEVLKKEAEKLLLNARKLPALDRNVRRLLASIKMLEINFSDLLLIKGRGKLEDS